MRRTMFNEMSNDHDVIDALTDFWSSAVDTGRFVEDGLRFRIWLENDRVIYDLYSKTHWLYVNIDGKRQAWLGVTNDGDFVYGRAHF